MKIAFIEWYVYFVLLLHETVCDNIVNVFYEDTSLIR